MKPVAKAQRCRTVVDQRLTNICIGFTFKLKLD
jgi:hypothetical protein